MAYFQTRADNGEVSCLAVQDASIEFLGDTGPSLIKRDDWGYEFCYGLAENVDVKN